MNPDDAELPAPVVTGAPERMWLVVGDLEHDDTFEALRDEICWCEHQVGSSDIAYVRADTVADLRALLIEARGYLSSDYTGRDGRDLSGGLLSRIDALCRVRPRMR